MQFLFVIIPKTYYKNVKSILQMNTIKLTKVFHAKGIYITQDNVRIVTIDLSSNFTFFVVHHTVFSSEHLKILFAYYMSVLLCPNSFKTNNFLRIQTTFCALFFIPSKILNWEYKRLNKWRAKKIFRGSVA